MAEIPKRWIYKVSTSSNVYLGLLQNVVGDFVLIQEINKVGPNAIMIEVEQSADTPMESVMALMTEDEKLITTEDGRVLTTEGSEQNFMLTGSMIRNGNKIEVVEISDYYPNGTTVFKGVVKKWNVNYGTGDNMKIYVTPSSADLNDHIAKGVEVVAVNQPTYNSTQPIYGGGTSGRIDFGYQMVAGFTTATNISSIAFRLAARDGAAPSTVTVSVIQFPSTTPYTTADYTGPLDNVAYRLGLPASLVVSSTTQAEYIFTFPTPIAINSANNFISFKIEATGTSSQGVNIAWSSTNVYGTEGSTWLWRFNDPVLPGQWGTYDDTLSALWTDFYFRMWTIPDYTKITLTNFEPSDTVKKFTNTYNTEGGVVTYDSANIENTGVTIASYTFSLSTVAETYDAMLGFSPATWYYTVDAGTNSLTFKKISTTADFTIVYRKHIENLDLSASIEGLKNSVYLTGGLVGANNLFLLQNNTQSIAEFGVSIDRITDARITSAPAGATRITAHLDRYDDEAFETVVTLLETATNIAQYKVGKTVGFRGFGTTVDDLILPIVRVVRYKDRIELSIGSLPLRSETIVDETASQLATLQTINNPTQPS